MDAWIKEYNYELPSDRIATEPLEDRAASKLLVLQKNAQNISDSSMLSILEWLQAGDVLVLNDTKVMHARIAAERESGGQVEVFLLDSSENSEESIRALLKPSRKLKEGEVLRLSNSLNREGSLFQAEITLVKKMLDGEWLVRVNPSANTLMDLVGQVPIPPYFNRQSTETDQTRYQTVFASEKGAVAAPTAGLHFTPSLLAALKERGVEIHYITLHVGIGTFRNLREEDILRGTLHEEWYRLPPETANAINKVRKNGGRVVACGTTVTRCLEAAWNSSQKDNLLNLGDILPTSGYTNIFIREGYSFHVVDALLTNFHLPKSSLLMLVSAFAGREVVLHAYQHAIDNHYRFFSYGDAMLILP